MALAQRLVQRQTQKQGLALVMTQQLTQSIRLLAMSNAELDAFVEEAVERNPLLARAEPPASPPAPLVNAPAPSPAETVAATLDADVALIDPDARHHLARGTAAPAADVADVWERADCAPVSLADHLHEQIAMAGRRAAVTAAARALVHDLDDAGYLREPDALRERASSKSVFDEALALLRSLEPVGVGACDLADCLALQLAARDRLDPAMRALLGNLPLLAVRDFPGLERATGLGMGDLLDALGEIRALDPKPALRFAAPPAPIAPPDVIVSEGPRGWHVELNAETLPRVLVDRDYHATVAPAAHGEEAKAWLAERMEDAHWLVRAMDQRARTTVAVTREIVRRQDAFLLHGPAHMRPLTLAQVADAVGVHESTVSRVTTAKTLACPRGVFALKHFFAAALRASDDGEAHSATAVQERIRAMVACEGASVLSDDAMVARLEAEGVRIARRTVAKYRGRLNIPSSAVRKREAKALALA